MKIAPDYDESEDHPYIDEKPDIKEDETIRGRKTTISYRSPKQPLKGIAGSYRSPLFIDYVNRPDYWTSWTDSQGE